MANILVLGCGLVGKTIVKDLANRHRVLVLDLSPTSLEAVKGIPNVESLEADISESAILEKLAKDFDLVVSAVPGFLGFQTLKKLIELQRNVVDIAFFPENPFELNELARAKNVTCIVDCGIAPGLSHMIIGYHSSIEKIDEAIIYVGGLPFERNLPFEYKAPFSPVDVLEEYIRPARILHNGKIIEKEPLSEIEYLNFRGIGTLEAFLTDGLRTLLSTVNIPFLKEKTLRYPGYAEKIKFLKQCGFFASDPVETKSGKIAPIRLTEKLLLSQWKLEQDDEEFTIMRIVLGSKEKNKKYVYELYDRTDKINNDYSMGRTTGFVASAVSNLLTMRDIARKGIIPPEILAQDKEVLQYVIDYLKERKIKIEINEFEYGRNF
ncbi:MAG: saccharopine dehydrogenase family protein [Candidatus Kapaibacteriota bacterium]